MYKVTNLLKSFNYKKLIVPFIFIVIFIFSFIFLYYRIDNKSIKDEPIDYKNNFINEEEEKEEFIYVDIKGEVNNPGVYRLNMGSRVNDLIDISGGLSKNANTRFINLSKVLNDGDAIVIYSNSEIRDATKTNTIYVETPCVCQEVKNDACIIENSNTIVENNTSKININTASIEELITLSGIGESKAKSIIEYREKNGLFKSIDELSNVSGISETILSKIKENITT